MRPLNQLSNQECSEEEVNITPMLDVVFIMLIFFVVTASFVKQDGIGIGTQQTGVPPNEKHENVLIRVWGTGGVEINGRDVDIRAIGANLLRFRAENPNAKVVLAAEDNAKNGAVVAILDASRAVGIYDVSFTEI
ncbi:MAG: biopolymer transporter ExbD [Pseudomonadota bacterium]